MSNASLRLVPQQHEGHQLEIIYAYQFEGDIWSYTCCARSIFAKSSLLVCASVIFIPTLHIIEFAQKANAAPDEQRPAARLILEGLVISTKERI